MTQFSDRTPRLSLLTRAGMVGDGAATDAQPVLETAPPPLLRRGTPPSPLGRQRRDDLQAGAPLLHDLAGPHPAAKSSATSPVRAAIRLARTVETATGEPPPHTSPARRPGETGVVVVVANTPTFQTRV